MGRRRRGLSAEESELWGRVAATTRPMRDVAAVMVPDPAPVTSVADSPRPVRRRLSASAPTITVDLAPDPHEALRTANPHMDRRRFEKLRRGQMQPDARLDLHGMTSDEAHRRLVDFILTADAIGHRLVLIITGKGRAADDGPGPRRHGILRHSLPHWLAAPPLAGRILQVAEAHVRHGGAGAFYVCLRRRR